MARLTLPVLVLAFATLPGCCCEGPAGPRFFGPDDAAAFDGGTPCFIFCPPPGIDAGRDAAPDARPDAGACVSPSPCTTTSCGMGTTCWPAQISTVQESFEIMPGAPSDPLHPGYAATRPSDPSLDPPLHLLTPSLCMRECDLDGPDTCGGCARCDGRLSQSPLVAAFGGVRIELASPSFPHPGLCRPRCTFDATGTGDCPEGSTCDPVGVCIEACTDDLECNADLGVAYDGTLVTVDDPAHARVCDLDTGRCAVVQVLREIGEACTFDRECASALCANGHCTEPCARDADCLVGALCVPHALAGADAPTLAHGRCEMSCDVVDARGAAGGCFEGEYCRDLGGGRRTCAPLGGFCTTDPPADALRWPACGAGQICDALLAGVLPLSIADGHCADACTSDADCASLPGFECVTSGPLTGACRQHCGTSGPCYAGMVCDAATGYCGEAPP